MEQDKIKIFIVDDSPVARDLLSFVLELDPSLKIMGYAENGQEALKWLKSQTPDVITMDITMPYIDGFETTRQIMKTRPIPIVIVSSGYTLENSEKSFKAIEAGALAIIQKPQGIYDKRLITELHQTIHTLAGMKLITRRNGNHALLKKKNLAIHPRPINAIAIGASLGGPIALEKILSRLPKSIPVPIFIVQHISKGFTKGLVDWLQKKSALTIRIPEDGEMAQPKTVYVAPDDSYMTVIKGNRIGVSHNDPKDWKPGIGKLFLSMSQIYGPSAMGIILTGMGKDGAEELLTMKEKGALTVAQDEESCILFGMPKEAIKLGAAKLVLPLEEIAETIILACSQSQKI